MIDINNIINNAIHSAVTATVDAYLVAMRLQYDQEIAALKAEIEQLKQQPAPTTTTTTPVTPELAQDVLRLLTDSPSIKQAVFEIAHDAAESLLADHLEAYDHDEYDRVVRFIDEDLPSDFDDFVKTEDLPEFPDVDTLVTKDDLGDAIEEKLNELVDTDEFVTKDELPDFDDFITKGDLQESVREAVRETLENRVSVSLYLS